MWMTSWEEEGERCDIIDVGTSWVRRLRSTEELRILFLALITAPMTTYYTRGTQAGRSVSKQWHLLYGTRVFYEVFVAFSARVRWEMRDAFLVVRRPRCLEKNRKW